MRQALGRGLSQLIAEEFDSIPRDAPIDAIDPNPRQPRSVFDDAALNDLADSIRAHGVLQPLVVRPKSENRFELIAGERRLRAAKLAGLDRVPIVLRSADAQDSLELALIENIQREDIGPMERATAYRRLMDEFGMTQEDVSARVGKARASVANTLRLLRLPERIREGLANGLISEGHAKAILAVETPEAQEALYDRILEGGFNVRETERLAQGPQRTEKVKLPRPLEEIDPNRHALQEALSIYLGSPIQLTRSGVGGKVVIEFYSDEDLERVLERIGFAW